MTTRKFELFTEKVDGQDIEFKVYAPTIENYKEAAKARNTAFIDALNAKAPLRAQLDTLLRARGEWSDERQKQWDEYNKSLLEYSRQLKKGGMKLSSAKEIAMKMKQIRGQLTELLSTRSALDNMTAEGQADNAHFNALVSCCLVYNNTDVRYFESVDAYNLASTDNIANIAATKLAGLLYTIGVNAEKSLPENEFLVKYKFVDEKLRLINKDGHLVDSEGRLIDENNRYVDKDGNFTDKFGYAINVDGEYDIKTEPFLDDDSGQPIVEAEGKEVIPS